MIFNAIPDLLSFNRFNRVTTNLKAQLDQTSIEAVTGRREDITKATGGDVGSALLLNKALSDIEDRTRIFSLTKTRISLTSESLSGARQVIDKIDIRGIAALTSGSSSGVTTIISEADTALRSTFSLLRVKSGDRSLFSGNATDQQPLADVDTLLADIRTIISAGPDNAAIQTALDTYFNDPAGGFQTNIYRGGDGNAPPVSLSGGVKADFTVRADDPAIKNLIRGLAVVAAADSAPFIRTSNDYEALFRSGTSSIATGETGVIELEANLGIALGSITRAEDLQAFEKITLTAAYNDATARDQFEAASQLKLLETQLEASYVLTARLSDLTLVNFVR